VVIFIQIQKEKTVTDLKFLHILLVEAVQQENYMGAKNAKRLTVTLDDYVVKIAEEKAKVMFKGNIDNYINWLICTNNKHEIKKAVKLLEKKEEDRKPVAVKDTKKTAMYNNTCDYCKEPIYQGDEICKAEGYENYIHSKCCKKVEEPSE
jgi:hypothetical protein